LFNLRSNLQKVPGGNDVSEEKLLSSLCLGYPGNMNDEVDVADRWFKRSKVQKIAPYDFDGKV
jgi:hypothetical protein